MIKFVVVSLALAGVAGVGGAVFAGDPQREAEIRAWLTEKIAEKRPVRELDEGIYLKWEVETTSRLSIQEVNRRWKEVAPYPDHPERGNLEYHRQLLQEPATVTGELWYAGSGAWLQVVDRGPVWGLLRSGGLNKDRWMLSTSGSVPAPNAPAGYKPKVRQHLTAIRAGEPYPAICNVGRLFDDARGLLATCLLRGLPWISTRSEVERVELSGATWSAFLRRGPGAEANLRIRGGYFSETGEPIISTIDYVNSGSSVQYEYSSYYYASLAGGAFPRQIVYDRIDSTRESYRLRAIERVSRREVAEVAVVPEIGSAATTSDFRHGENPELLTTPEAQQLVWEVTKSGDQYRPLAAPTVADSAVSHAQHKPASGWSGKRIAATSIVVGLVFLMIAAYRHRQQGLVEMK